MSLHVSHSSPLISVILVNYNSWPDIDDCLKSLEEQTYRPLEVIVVDNASHADQKTALKKQKYKLDIKFIWSEKNTGFTGGCNLGAAQAKGQYVALLNPDAIAEPDWLVRLAKVLDSLPAVGITVGKIYRVGDSPVKNRFDSAGSLYNQIGSAWSRGYLEKDTGQYDKEEEIPMATAGGFLFRREILDQTYLFDDSFFMYMEEFDFCLRARQLGYKIIYTPQAILYHKFSQSVKKASANVTLFKQFYGNRARIKMLAKYYPLRIIVPNLHLICLSFVYWDLYFLRYGGAKRFMEFKNNQLRFLRAGLKERRVGLKNQSWTQWIQYQSFSELLGWSRESRQREKSAYHER